MKHDNTRGERRPSAVSVGIIGLGYVGGALERYFGGKIEQQGTVDIKTGLVAATPATRAAEIVPAATSSARPSVALYRYDKFKKIGSPAEVNRAETIFVCVPTPYDEKRGFDLAAVGDAFRTIKGAKVVVIKSTVLPGTTEYFQKKYPRHKVLFNPEFLTQSTADTDMLFPDRQIIGYTKKSYDVAKDILQLLPLAPFERIIPASEAEMAKYFNNTWFATKVVFANQIYDLCEKLGMNYDVVKECAAADKRIGRSHLEIWHGGYRGFGGGCLPKDTKSLVRMASQHGVDLGLLKAVVSINKRLNGIKPNFRGK